MGSHLIFQQNRDVLDRQILMADTTIASICCQLRYDPVAPKG